MGSAVAHKHGVAYAQWDRCAIGGVVHTRGRALSPLVSLHGSVPADELFDQRDEYGLEGQLRKLVGQQHDRGPVLRHERLIGEELDVHLGLRRDDRG